MLTKILRYRGISLHTGLEHIFSSVNSQTKAYGATKCYCVVWVSAFYRHDLPGIYLSCIGTSFVSRSSVLLLLYSMGMFKESLFQ